VPIDEIIEKVSSMGFSKDQVRAVVRRLTENGQSVDLNIVLDKLMNGGGDVQPQKGWFGRVLKLRRDSSHVEDSLTQLQNMVKSRSAGTPWGQEFLGYRIRS